MAIVELQIMRSGTFQGVEGFVARGLSRATIDGHMFSRVVRWSWPGVTPGPDLIKRERQADRHRGLFQSLANTWGRT